MFSEHFAALMAPNSAEHFANSLEQICLASNAEHFILLKLQGLGKRQVVQVVHNGGEGLEALIGPPRHPMIDRLVMAIANAPVPSMRLGPGHYELKVEGFVHGVAAFTRDENFGSILVLARRAPAVEDGDLMTMASNAALAAQLTLAAFAAEPAKTCPLRPRELECLRYYVAGFGPKETAQALGGLSARTVEGHLERARLRCGVETSIAAAMMAINEGWIQPSEIRQLEATG